MDYAIFHFTYIVFWLAPHEQKMSIWRRFEKVQIIIIIYYFVRRVGVVDITPAS